MRLVSLVKKRVRKSFNKCENYGVNNQFFFFKEKTSKSDCMLNSKTSLRSIPVSELDPLLQALSFGAPTSSQTNLILQHDGFCVKSVKRKCSTVLWWSYSVNAGRKAEQRMLDYLETFKQFNLRTAVCNSKRVPRKAYAAKSRRPRRKGYPTPIPPECSNAAVLALARNMYHLFSNRGK